MSTDYTCILVDTRGEGPLRQGWITLHRPKQMNALNDTLMTELGAALRAFDADDGIGCIVLTGSEKAFAAGADIQQMASYGYADVYGGNFVGRNWDTLREIRKPVVAAVAGFALGGGCEVAMACDFIIAADNARFGQPEIKLGLVPGAGGTQRLTHAIGKAKAMEMVLTGRLMNATEAEAAGLVARIVPLAELQAEVGKVADAICAQSRLAAMSAKECVNRAFESSLSEGLLFERRQFHAAFATQDKQEGTAAFLEKRPPVFTHR